MTARYEVRKETGLIAGYTHTTWVVVDTYEETPDAILRGRFALRADADMQCDTLNAQEGAHVHTPGPVKFNGGRPVRLCDDCREIIGRAEVSDL